MIKGYLSLIERASAHLPCRHLATIHLTKRNKMLALTTTVKFITKREWNDYPHNQACGASLRDKGGWIGGTELSL